VNKIFPYSKTIVCLANSRRPPSGRCIAGREITESGFGDWIRPISNRPSHEVSEEERRFQDGTDPNIFDVITIPFLRPEPCEHQSENHLIDDQQYWVLNRRLTWGEIQASVDTPTCPLWSNTSSTYFGINDRVSANEALQQKRSLYLIRPEKLIVVVQDDGTAFGKPRRRVRANFYLSGCHYRLIVTDPRAERRFFLRSDGSYPIANALICVSLGELHSDGFAYKLVTSIIEKQ